MAILKHIKSRNANYSNAIDYLLFQHDESTGKKIKDEMGRSLLRDEFYMDGLNCDPMSFDKECSLTNAKFHKNKKSSEIKSHHYIMMSKHVVSLYDMCYSSLLQFDLEQWDEKITDCINYLILLKALIKEEQAYGSH